MKKQLLPALQALLAALLFGISAPLSKLLLGEVEAVPLAGWLYLGSGCGSLLFLLWQHWRESGRPIEARLTQKEIPALTGAIFAGGVAAPILLLIGLQRTPASSASLLLNFEAVGTTLLAVLLFHEAVDRRILWAVGLITLASILLSMNGNWNGSAFGFSVGALAILAACLLWGLDNNLTRTISAKDPLVIVTLKGLGAGGFSLLLSRILGMPSPRPGIILLAMLLGALSYGLSIRLFILALRELGSSRTSALFGTAPFAGSLLSLFLFHELPPVLFWVSIPVMLAGAWLMLSEKHLHSHVHEAMEHSHSHSHPDEHHAHSHIEEDAPVNGSHVHWHRHDILEHAHPHTPDLHHRHDHKAP
jgi:drug/metabolite transporter (DMT)-like permease